MKMFYEIPELEIVAFEAEDIITTSGGMTNAGTGDWGDGGYADFSDLLFYCNHRQNSGGYPLQPY